MLLQVEVRRAAIELPGGSLVAHHVLCALVERELIAREILQGRLHAGAALRAKAEQIGKLVCPALRLIVILGERREPGRIVGVERAAALAEQIRELAIALVDPGNLVRSGLLLIAGAEDIEDTDGRLL